MIDFLIKNRSFFKSYTMKICKNAEFADDILQQVALRFLMNSPKDIVSPEGFVKNTIKQVFYSYSTTNSKYCSFLDVKIVEDEIEKPDFFFEEDLLDSIALKQVKKLSNSLTKPRQHEILLAANGQDLVDRFKNSFDPAYETAKTHKRLAVLDMKKIVGGDCESE